MQSRVLAKIRQMNEALVHLTSYHRNFAIALKVWNSQGRLKDELILHFWNTYEIDAMR